MAIGIPVLTAGNRSPVSQNIKSGCYVFYNSELKENVAKILI